MIVKVIRRECQDDSHGRLDGRMNRRGLSKEENGHAEGPTDGTNQHPD